MTFLSSSSFLIPFAAVHGLATAAAGTQHLRSLDLSGAPEASVRPVFHQLQRQQQQLKRQKELAERKRAQGKGRGAREQAAQASGPKHWAFLSSSAAAAGGGDGEPGKGGDEEEGGGGSGGGLLEVLVPAAALTSVKCTAGDGSFEVLDVWSGAIQR